MTPRWTSPLTGSTVYEADARDVAAAMPAGCVAVNRLGVVPGMTWSCYQPNGRLPCGQCAACLRRAL